MTIRANVIASLRSNPAILNISILKKLIMGGQLRHGEAIRKILPYWIASGFALAMTVEQRNNPTQPVIARRRHDDEAIQKEIQIMN